MSKKDCAFQYALGRPPLGRDVIIENTPLITYEEATKLWNKYLLDFMRELVNGSDPEMAIWTGMDNASDYHTDKHHIDASDCEVEGGRLYVVTRKEVTKL